MKTKPTKKSELRKLKTKVRRLEQRLEAVLSLKVELKEGRAVYEKVKVAQLHTYLREHGWTSDPRNLQAWTPPDGDGPYRTLDREGYADHPQRMAEMIRYCSEIEKRSPIAVLFDLMETKTNTLDKLADAISAEDE